MSQRLGAGRAATVMFAIGCAACDRQATTTSTTSDVKKVAYTGTITVPDGEGCGKGSTVRFDESTKLILNGKPARPELLAKAAKVEFVCKDKEPASEITIHGPAVKVEMLSPKPTKKDPKPKSNSGTISLVGHHNCTGSTSFGFDDGTKVTMNQKDLPWETLKCATEIDCSSDKAHVELLATNPVCRVVLAMRKAGPSPDPFKPIKNDFAVKSNVIQWSVNPEYLVNLPKAKSAPAEKTASDDKASRDGASKNQRCNVISSDLAPDVYRCADEKPWDDRQQTFLLNSVMDAMDILNFELEQPHSWQSGQSYVDNPATIRVSVSPTFLKVEAIPPPAVALVK